jgi:hypothetical protein
MSMANGYEYLEDRPGSSIKQPFVKGRKIWAEVLYRETVGLEPRTPEQVTEDFELPLGAVLEAIEFCTKNELLLQQERERADVRFREFEKRYPPLRPPWYKSEP